MTYLEFKYSISSKLNKKSSGMTWNELKAALDLPYEQPCPEWVKQLEREIGLVRRKGTGRALVWRVGKPPTTSSPGAASTRRSRVQAGRPR